MTDEIQTELGEWDVDYEYRNPVWNRHGTIDVEINHPKMGWVPCTVDNIDYTLMWARLMKDDVAPYVPDLVQLDILARLDRQTLLRTHVDPFVSNPLRWASMADADKEAILAYREALLNITEQPDYPVAIVWPGVPDGVSI